jgi:hypothetical protein
MTSLSRHCGACGDEGIEWADAPELDCFAALAMTAAWKMVS